MSSPRVLVEWDEEDDPRTPTVNRPELARIVRAQTPVDLLWLRTTVEDELLRRGYKPAPLHKQ